MAVQKLLGDLKSLNDEEYKTFMYQSLDTSRPPEIQRAVVKYLGKKEKPLRVRAVGKEYLLKVTLWDILKNQSLAHLGRHPKQPLKSDLVPENEPVFLDVEKLSLKKLNANDTHQMVASSLAVVNDNKDLILWSFINWSESDICQTFPGISGITKQKLEIGLEIKAVSPFVTLAFSGNLVVGYDIENDLQALATTAEKKFDLSFYYCEGHGKQRKPYKLKDVWEHFFGGQIQCEAHSAIQDARATRDIYYKYLELVKEYPDFNQYPDKIQRSAKQPFKFNANDQCTCPKKKAAKIQAIFQCQINYEKWENGIVCE